MIFGINQQNKAFAREWYRRHTHLLLLAISYLSLMACGTVKATAAPASSKKLGFDSKTSIGIMCAKNGKGQQFATRAKGDVVCPDWPITLVANHDLVLHPELLDRLPANAFETIEFSKLEEDLAPVMRHIAHLTGLRHLTVRYCPLADEGIKELAPLKNLSSLCLQGTGMNGTCFKDLKTMTSLDTLSVRENKIDFKNLHYLSDLPALTFLELNNTKMTDSDVALVAKLPHLKHLDICHNPITVKGLVALKQCPKLEELRLLYCKVSPNDIVVLQKMPLRKLEIRSCSAEDRAKLQKAFPHCILTFTEADKDKDKFMRELFAPVKR